MSLKAKPRVILVNSYGSLRERISAIFFSSLTFVYFVVHAKITAKYKQSLMGLVFIVFGPLVEIMTWVFVLGYVAKIRSADGIPYVILIYSGIIIWKVFFEAYKAGIDIFRDNDFIIRNIYVSKFLLLVSQVVCCFVDSVVFTVFFCCALAYYGFLVEWTIFVVCIYLFCVIVVGISVGVLFSYVHIMYRDFFPISSSVLDFLKYASPVVYGVNMVPDNVLFWYSLNPFVLIISTFRYLTAGVYENFDVGISLIGFFFLLVIGIVGLFVYFHKSKTVVDIL